MRYAHTVCLIYVLRGSDVMPVTKCCGHIILVRSVLELSTLLTTNSENIRV